MTKEYKERLVTLARDVKDELDTPIVFGKDTTDTIENKSNRVKAKINYLLGYILALENLSNDNGTTEKISK